MRGTALPIALTPASVRALFLWVRWKRRDAPLPPHPQKDLRAPLARDLISREVGHDGSKTLFERVSDSHHDGPLVAALRSQSCGLRAGSAMRWQQMREAHLLPPHGNRMRASKT